MFIFKHPFAYFETSEPAGGGSGVVATPPVQTPVQGGEPDFWGMFPDVPNEHRPLLEPHIKGMQGHVTKLEQQLAPFKPFVDAGLDPQSAVGLLRFSNDFEADPRGMWLRIGNMLQEKGDIDPELDLEYLAALASGEDPDEGGEQQVPEGMDPNVAQLTQTIQELRSELDGIKQTDQQRQAQRQQQIQDQLLDKRMAGMRSALTEAGYPEDALTDQLLIAQVIAHNGNLEAATKSMVDMRSSVLKGFTDNRNQEQELEMPNGVPGTPKENGPSVRERNDPFAKARPGAQQALRMANRAAARE